MRTIYQRRLPAILESLEDRRLPVQFGIPWPVTDGQPLTISFAPDNTPIDLDKSDLIDELDDAASDPNNPLPVEINWATEILRAFQSWAVHTELDFGLVDDNGLAFGISGRVQGDSRFGDIRIGGIDLSGDVLATAVPFQPTTAGTWSGDVIVNLEPDLTIAGATDAYDLYSILLHEAGHVLGLPPNESPDSALYNGYIGPITGPSTDDIQAIQQLYGTRTPDLLEGPQGNQTLETATPLDLPTSPDAETLVIDADLTTAQDRDMFRFQAMTDDKLVIRVRTEGISLAAPQLNLFDAQGSPIATVATQGPLDGDLEVILDEPVPGQSYVVEVTGAPLVDEVFRIGSYRLEIGPDTPPAEPQDMTPILDDGTNERITEASTLPLTPLGPMARYAEVFGQLEMVSDVDVYAITAPANGGSLQISIGSIDESSVPDLLILEGDGTAVDVDVIASAQGMVTVQVPTRSVEVDYFVTVRQSALTGPSDEFDYALTVLYTEETDSPITFADTALEDPNIVHQYSLEVHRDSLTHLILDAESQLGSDGAIRMEIRSLDGDDDDDDDSDDGPGELILQVDVTSGSIQSVTPYLLAGSYTVTFRISPETPEPVGPISYRVQGLALDDPLGMAPRDPSDAPAPADPPENLPFSWEQLLG